MDAGLIDPRLRSFGVFIEMERRLRHAKDLVALSFLLVNETFNFVRYRQALLWRSHPDGGGRVQAVSGLAVADPHAPFIQWASRLCTELQADEPAEADGQVGRVFGLAQVSQALGQDWAQWLPTHGLWLPLTGSDGRRLGGLLLAREDAWSDSERHLLGYLTDACGHAWGSLEMPRRGWSSWRDWRQVSGRRWYLAGTVAALILALWPVRQTALAPAEVVALEPAVVRAPIDGVVDRFEIAPNDMVKKGQVLLHLDATKLDSRLKVARKALEVLAAELRQAEQQALFDEASRVNLSILKSRAQQQSAEVDYVQGLIDRSEVRAPRAGMAVFDDVNNWLGRPVSLGERILMVADPTATEIEVRLPVADALALKQGAQVRLFLNIAPNAPVDGALRYASYEATKTPEGLFAYRLLARVVEHRSDLRIGLKGTAKVYGDQTVLIVYLLRKPIVALRQFFGV